LLLAAVPLFVSPLHNPISLGAALFVGAMSAHLFRAVKAGFIASRSRGPNGLVLAAAAVALFFLMALLFSRWP
jgi:hypothetical protein